MDQRRRRAILRRFGKAVRAYRVEAGVSQEKLAAIAKLDRTYVGGVERGERNLSLVNIVRLADALSVKPSTLLAAADASESG